MSSEVTVRANGLSKCYPIFDRPEDRLKQMLSFGRRKYYREFWALRDLSFEVARGETVGIVGRNGAGKSTLLQLICGTVLPSSGEIEVCGQVAALLELGTGFNPEFSGHENVFMSGTILGLGKDEILARYDDIVAFADIGPFMDQPVKTYSTGMHMRLAFAVVANLDPQVLVVDEALAVGDLAFQRKCFRKIQTIVDSGGTLLFVSHDIETVKKICSRALFLEKGERRGWGEAKAVCREYEELLFGASRMIPDSVNEATTKRDDAKGVLDPDLLLSCEKAYGDGRAVIEDLSVRDAAGRRANVFEIGQRLKVSYIARFTADVVGPIFGMMLTTREGVCVFGTNTAEQDCSLESFRPGDEVRVSFELLNNLAPGIFYLTCGVHTRDSAEGLVFLQRRIDALLIKSVDSGAVTIAGLAHLYSSVKVEKFKETAAAI